MKNFIARLPFIASLLMFCPSPALAGEVRLSVAASLKEVITELSDGFAGKRAVRFVKNFGPSGALAKQIDNGAPADIFIPASRKWMDYLATRKVADGTSIVLFAHNTLVFAGDPSKKVAGMQDLARLDRIACGSPKSVPAGEYATEAMKAAGMERQLEKKLVVARDVRDCLMYAERGEVDGAFLYRTDLLQARHAKILFTVPQKLYAEVVYPMALTVAGTRNRDAVAFFKYLQSGDAKAVLKKYGFALR